MLEPTIMHDDGSLMSQAKHFTKKIARERLAFKKNRKKKGIVSETALAHPHTKKKKQVSPPGCQ